MKRVDCTKCENTSCLFKNSNSSKWVENLYVPSGQHIFSEDMDVKGLYIVQKGIVKEYYHDKEGRQKTNHTARNGDIFGQRDYSAIKHAFSAITLKDTCICFIKKTSLYQVCLNNSELSLTLMRFFVAELNKSEVAYKYNLYNIE